MDRMNVPEGVYNYDYLFNSIQARLEDRIELDELVGYENGCAHNWRYKIPNKVFACSRCGIEVPSKILRYDKEERKKAWRDFDE